MTHCIECEGLYDPNKARKCPGPIARAGTTDSPDDLDAVRSLAKQGNNPYRFKSGERALRFDGQKFYLYALTMRKPPGGNCRASEYRYPPCPECGATDLTCGEDCPLEQSR